MNDSLKDLIKEMPKAYKYAGMTSIALSIVIFLSVDHLTALRYRHRGAWHIERKSDSTILVLSNGRLWADKNFYKVSMQTSNSTASFSVIKTFQRDSSICLVVQEMDFKNNEPVENAEFVLREETFLNRIARFLDKF